MGVIKDRLLAIIDEYLMKDATPPETPPESVSDTGEKLSAEDSTEELPIYEAPASQIEYWHAFGSNVHLQNLLREYDLDNSSANVSEFNRFKIGLDVKRHVATFASDRTHYYAIDFNQWNSAPLDSAQARRVLKKISAIKFQNVWAFDDNNLKKPEG